MKEQRKPRKDKVLAFRPDPDVQSLLRKATRHRVPASWLINRAIRADLAALAGKRELPSDKPARKA